MIGRYCWGGACCLQLGRKEHLLDAIVPTHPAPPKVPGDINAVKVPICFVHAEKDGVVTTKQVEGITEALRTRQPPLKHLGNVTLHTLSYPVAIPVIQRVHDSTTIT